MARFAAGWRSGCSALFLCLACLSCSNGDETPAPIAEGSSQFCAAYANAVCEVYVPCNCSPGGMPECIEAWRNRCLDYATDQERDGRRFVSAAGQACLSRVAAHVRDCTIVDATQFLPEPWYCELFQSTLPLGAECRVTADCAQPGTGRATCFQAPAAPSRCTHTHTLAIGEPCLPGGFEQSCLPGLWCNETTGLCSEPAALGARCSFRSPESDFSCTSPYYCSPTTGLCTTPANLGQPCEPYFARSTCEPGSDCQDQQPTCEPSLVSEFARCQVD